MKKKWPEIWLEIAEAYWTLAEKQDNGQQRITAAGLCNAINVICGRGSKDTSLGIRVCCDTLNPMGSVVWWKYSRRNDTRRARFAEHMAGLSHEDFKEFIS